MYWLSITIGWARYTGLCVRIMGVVSNWYISNYQWFLMLGWQYFDMLCHVKVWTHQQDPWKSFVDGIYWLPRACVAVDSARYPCFFAPGQGRDGRGVNTRILLHGEIQAGSEFLHKVKTYRIALATRLLAQIWSCLTPPLAWCLCYLFTCSRSLCVRPMCWHAWVLSSTNFLRKGILPRFTIRRRKMRARTLEDLVFN